MLAELKRPPTGSTAEGRAGVAEETAEITVVVADDHPALRDGVVTRLCEEGGIEVIAQAGDGRDALTLIRAMKPDVALLDVRMPEMTGPEILDLVKSEELDTRIIFLSAFIDGGIVHDAIAQGANGFIYKGADGEELRDAVRAAMAGETKISERLQRELIDHVRRKPEAGAELSRREREILGFVSQGLSSKAIGEKLFLSEATVKTYLRRVYAKLDVQTQAAAVAEAMRRGIIE